MSAMTLEEVLRSSLEGLNREFDEADVVLHAEVASADEALANVTKGTVRVRLELTNESEDGVTYALLLDPSSPKERSLGVLHVGAKGFPILLGESLQSLRRGEVVQEIKDSHDLKEYFHNMASNPDSPLVQKVAYLMRKKND